MPLAEALQLLLQLLRDAACRTRWPPPVGSSSRALPQGKTYQLLRMRIDETEQLCPRSPAIG